MKKLQKELEIISALLDWKVVARTIFNLRFKLHNNKLMTQGDLHSPWRESIICSLDELTLSAYEIEKEPQPKFKIGQSIWFIENNKVCSDIIKDIIIMDTIEPDNIRYWTKSRIMFMNDNKLFASKQELLESL